MSDRRCSIEGCDGFHKARGWCALHYDRWKRNGDPLKLVLAPACVPDLEERRANEAVAIGYRHWRYDQPQIEAPWEADPTVRMWWETP